MRTIPFLFPACLIASICAAQPPNRTCGTAALLCAQQPLPGDNTGTTGGAAPLCPGTANALWYSFTTNSRGGPVQVRVTGIDCPAVAGMGNALNVVVLRGNANCAPASWVAMSACASDTAEASVTTQALMPGTRYWVVVSGTLGGGATIAAQCGFGLVVDGPGADIVGVDLSAGEDVTIGPGESIRLSGSGGPPYDWSPTAGLSANGIPDPIASPIETTVYTLTTRINGCEFSDQVRVNVVRRISPPNTITPNGDGINDIWEVPGIADYPGAEVTIFDRWGQVVYRSTGYREPWDGTNGGKELPVGTYYYHIQLNQLEGRGAPYTGFISIVR